MKNEIARRTWHVYGAFKTVTNQWNKCGKTLDLAHTMDWWASPRV